MKLGRHLGIEVICVECGDEFIAPKVRVEEGLGKFCSKECFHIWQRKNLKSEKLGKENAKIYPYSNGKPGYFVQWIQENGKPKNLPWHIWIWEITYGEVPEGHALEYIDGDKSNLIVENLKLRLTRRGKQSLPKQPRKPMTQEHREKLSASLRNRWKLGEFKGVVFKDISKDKNPHWRGGIKNEYSHEFRKICPFIRGRDNHQCQICSKSVYKSKYGHIHHRDGNTKNNDQDNLLLLCASCHGKVHSSKSESPPIMALRSELHWQQ